MLVRDIALDIDGVLNKFIIEALAKFGTPIAYNDYSPDWGWEMLKGIEERYGRKVSDAEFWGAVKRDWWADSELSDEANAILDRCVNLVGKDHVFLLTSPTLDPDCVAGKLEWIQAKLPKWIQRQFLIGPHKHFACRPTTLLVDDGDHNVREWRAAGGPALLVPRPWNTNYDLAGETMLYVHARFDQLEEHNRNPQPAVKYPELSIGEGQ